LGRRTEETLAVAGGASRTTFFLGLPAASPSRLRFLLLPSPMVSRSGRSGVARLAMDVFVEVKLRCRVGCDAMGVQRRHAKNFWVLPFLRLRAANSAELFAGAVSGGQPTPLTIATSGAGQWTQQSGLRPSAAAAPD